MASKKCSIAEMAKLHQITFRALRFYEQQGLLSPHRVGHQRIYSAKDNVRVQLILKGKRLGLTLSEIKRLMDSLVIRDRDSGVVDQPDLLSVVGRDHVAKLIVELSIKRQETQAAIDQLNSALTRTG